MPLNAGQIDLLNVSRRELPAAADRQSSVFARKTMTPVVLASRRCTGRSFCGWYTWFKIDCSVLRLNRPEGCSGNGAGFIEHDDRFVFV